MYSTNHRSFVESIPVKFIAGTAVVATSAILYKTVVEDLVNQYGWDGFLRYIWEGEPYTPSIRKMHDSLSDAEAKRATQDKRLNGIEEALERARLDSVDERSEVRWLPATKDRATKAIVLQWAHYYKPKNLEITLGELSASLDKLAAQVDAVILTEANAKSNARVVDDIKRRKKLLSKQLVSLQLSGSLYLKWYIVLTFLFLFQVLDMERCDAFMTCYKLLHE